MKKKHHKTKFAILGLLTIKPLSGYEIKKWIESSIGYFWSESNGQIYPSLRELTLNRWIAPISNISNQSTKKQYTLTNLGRRELKRWMLETQDEKTIHRDENLLKLFFGSNISKKETITRLEKRKAQREKEFAEYKKIAEALHKSRTPHAIYWRIAIQNGIRSTKAEIQWCEESIQLLNS